MGIKFIRVFGSCLLLAAAACGGGSGSGSASSDASKPAVAAAGGDIGVAECDEYIKKYEACVSSKVPAAAQANMRQAFDSARATWKAAAANPQTRAGLAVGCKSALDTARTSMQAYGCTW